MSPEPECGAANGRRDWRPIRVDAVDIDVLDHCRLCYRDDNPQPGDVVLRASLGCLHKPDTDDLEPRNVVSADGGEA